MAKVSVVVQKGPEAGLHLSKKACALLDYYFTISRINPHGPVTSSGIPILDMGMPSRDIKLQGETLKGLYDDNYETIPRNHPYLLRVVKELGLRTSDNGELFVESIDVPKGSRSLWLIPGGEGGERAFGHEPRREERDIELDRPTVIKDLVDPAKILPIPKSPDEARLKAMELSKRMDEARLAKEQLAEAKIRSEAAQALALASETLAGLALPYNKEQALEVSSRLNKAVIFSEVDSVAKKQPSYFIACPEDRYVSNIPFESKPILFRNETAAKKVIADYLHIYLEDKGAKMEIDLATQKDIDTNMDVQAYLRGDSANPAESPAAREGMQFFRNHPASNGAASTLIDDVYKGMKPG